MQVLEDVREECGRCGVVVDVKIPRPTDPAQIAALMGKNDYGMVRLGVVSVAHECLRTGLVQKGSACDLVSPDTKLCKVQMLPWGTASQPEQLAACRSLCAWPMWTEPRLPRRPSTDVCLLERLWRSTLWMAKSMPWWLLLVSEGLLITFLGDHSRWQGMSSCCMKQPVQQHQRLAP